MRLGLGDKHDSWHNMRLQAEAYKPCLGFRCDCCGSAATRRQILKQELPSQVNKMARSGIQTSIKEEVVLRDGCSGLPPHGETCCRRGCNCFQHACPASQHPGEAGRASLCCLRLPGVKLMHRIRAIGEFPVRRLTLMIMRSSVPWSPGKGACTYAS